jgi:hypothetical protein
MTRRTLGRLLFGGIILVGSLTACGGGSRNAEDDRACAINMLTARSSAALRLHRYDTVDELLPNVSYRPPSGEAGPITDAVVIGRIVDTSVGRAFVNGDRRSTPVAFDDASADWKTLHLVVDVSDTIGGPAHDRIRVGLAIDGATDAEMVGDGLRGLGTVLLFLQHRPNPVFDYDPALFTDIEGGGLLATVDDAGRIRLPMKSQAEEAALLGSVRTVADLKAAGARPARTIQVDSLGERVE